MADPKAADGERPGSGPLLVGCGRARLPPPPPGRRRGAPTRPQGAMGGLASGGDADSGLPVEVRGSNGAFYKVRRGPAPASLLRAPQGPRTPFPPQRVSRKRVLRRPARPRPPPAARGAPPAPQRPPRLPSAPTGFSASSLAPHSPPRLCPSSPGCALDALGPQAKPREKEARLPSPHFWGVCSGSRPYLSPIHLSLHLSMAFPSGRQSYLIYHSGRQS